MTKKPWGGRFTEKTDIAVETFTSSINTDKRLYAYDIEGSIAHCQMLAKASIISDDDAGLLIQGLGNIKRQISHGQFEFADSLEDIHMHVETGLSQEVGKVARKLHTARSRNDQIALDIRMYLRDEITNILNRLIDLRKVILELAEKNIEIILPGYTHLQRAQPVLFSHYLMAYFEMFSRDAQRLKDCFKRINVMPLGSAALAGTTYPIDREYTAKLLNFPIVSANSIDSVSDRDFILEFLSCASIIMIHFSRISEELILWASSEFNFIGLPDSFSTGSSIMPQKKNPDVPELVRGKTGRVFGSLIALLTIMKSLPLAYNKDMQEDKEPLFDAVDTLKACIGIYIQMLPKLQIKSTRMLQAASEGFLNATDMADYLVIKGMPFREAHTCVGKAIEFALEQKKELHDLELRELKSLSSLFEKDVFEVLKTDKMINLRTSSGGTAAKNVVGAIKAGNDRINIEIDEQKKNKILIPQSPIKNNAKFSY